jgi:hypothetical protein
MLKFLSYHRRALLGIPPLRLGLRRKFLDRADEIVISRDVPLYESAGACIMTIKRDNVP